ncbi:MAG: hypothetical protein QOE65_2391 [Solirubrobacteraceae bacterium]|jgi:hypothetical protein|nr:hypothetical protein [Solirubrobacteraceae bacterium]
MAADLGDFERGVVLGVLVGQGSFGGDGKQPHVLLRMHVRHEALLRSLAAWFPRSRLYGPYDHGGRHYFQWVARGPALVEDLAPLLDAELTPELDAHAWERYRAMRDRYADAFGR